MDPKEPRAREKELFSRPTSLSDTQSWISSLVRQIRELRYEKNHPSKPVVLTSAPDPSVLSKFIETPSPAASLLRQLRAIIHDIRHPRKIETTSAPIEVEEIWSKQSMGIPGLVSLALHGGVVVFLLYVGVQEIRKPPATETTTIIYTPSDFLPLPLQPDKSQGGGGGGKKELTPPSLGKLPKADTKQLTPPDPDPKNLDPELLVEPTIVAPQLANIPRLNLPNLGDPFGIPGPPSSGPGTGGGIGTGTGHGVGVGSGPGAGPGQGGGFGDGVFKVGGGVSAPSVLRRVEPQYSEEARKARYQGTVVLEAIVRKDGTVDILRVVRGIGFGLDENAIQALKQWKFKPGMRNGQAVDVALNIEVNFNLR